jgi:hypothetical protein
MVQVKSFFLVLRIHFQIMERAEKLSWEMRLKLKRIVQTGLLALELRVRLY